MQKHFSPQLIERCQKIFSKRSGLSVSAEKAEIYLEKLARLGEVAVRIQEQEIITKKGGDKYERSKN